MGNLRIGICLAAGLLSLSPALADEAATGAALFEENCAACHAEGGVGTPGFAPPLNRPAFWSGLGDQAAHYISSVTAHGLNGTIDAAGEKYVGLAMPPVAGVSDEDMAAINTWVLASLGETDLAVTVEDIAKAREERTSAADLRAMRPKDE